MVLRRVMGSGPPCAAQAAPTFPPLCVSCRFIPTLRSLRGDSRGRSVVLALALVTTSSLSGVGDPRCLSNGNFSRARARVPPVRQILRLELFHRLKTVQLNFWQSAGLSPILRIQFNPVIGSDPLLDCCVLLDCFRSRGLPNYPPGVVDRRSMIDFC
jgi:hypothetical protein